MPNVKMPNVKMPNVKMPNVKKPSQENAHIENLNRRLILGLAVLLAATLLAGSASADDAVVVQTAVNGSFDAAAGTVTLNEVFTVTPTTGDRWASVRNQAFVKTFSDVFADAAGRPLATLVVEDAAGDGSRSHHLVRLSSPTFVQSSNQVTYRCEVLNSQSLPSASLRRVFVFFESGRPRQITAPEPLAEIDVLSAAEIQEAFSAQTATGGGYDPADNLLTLRGVKHFLLVDRPLTETLTTDAATFAEGAEEAVRNVPTKPIATLTLMGDGGDQQVILRLEDIDYDAASDELRYPITALESSAALPKEFGAAMLTAAPNVAFGRGWPSHSVCCDCNASCSVLWVAFGYCKTCVSPLGGDKCCSTCDRPASPGGSCS